MLVLSRRIGESIIIGDNIVIKVVKIGLNQVSIGLDAPREVNIRRSELSPNSQHPKEPNGGIK